MLVEKTETVYDEPPVTIDVTIHGHLKAHVTVSGNGSVTPSDITWSTWKTVDLTVSADANAQNGHIIEIETATEYVVYFTVTVKVGPIDVFEEDSPTKKVSGSPIIQSSIDVIPEFPTLIALIAVTLMTSSVALFGSKKIRAFY